MSASMGTISVTLTAVTAQFAQSMKGAAANIKQMQGDLVALSATFAAVGLAAGAAAKSVVSTASGLESAMVRVQAVSQANQQQFEALTATAKKLGATTEFSAKQVAEGMGFMAMSGAETTQIIKGMPAVLQLATAGAMDLASASDIVTNIVTGMGMSIDELNDVNNTLVATMTKSNVDLRQLGTAFKFVGPVAKSAGIAFEEVSASIGLLGNAGIQGSMAGTTLRGAISRILKPSKEAQGVMTDLGVSFTDAKGKIRPLVEIIGQLQIAGAQTADFMTLFGQRAGPGMAALVEQGTASFVKLTEAIEKGKEADIAAIIQEAQLNTFAGQLQILSSSMEAFSNSIGEALMPIMRSVVEVLKGAFDWFNKLHPSIKKVLGVGLLLVAALAPILAALTAVVALLPSFVAGLGAAKVAFVALMAAAPVILGIVAAVVSLIGVVGALQRAFGLSFGGIMDFAVKLGKGMIGIFLKVADVIKTVLLLPLQIIEKGGNLMGKLLGIDNAGSTAANVIRSIGSALNPITNLKAAGDSLLASVKTGFADAGKSAGSTMGNELKKKLDAIMAKAGAAMGPGRSGGPGAQIELTADDIFGEGFGGLEIMPTSMDINFEDVFGKGMTDLSATGDKFMSGLSGFFGDMSKQLNKNADLAVEMAKENEDNLKKHEAYWAKQDRAFTGANIGKGAKQLATGIASMSQEVNSIVQGFMQGGFIGAIVALIMNIIKEMPSFQEQIAMISDVFKMLGEIFNPLVAVMTPTVTLLKDFVNMLRPLGPMLEMIAKVLFPFGKLLKYIGVVIGVIILVVGAIWNAIIEALRGFLKLFEWLPGDRVENAREALKDSKVDLDQMGENIKTMAKEGVGALSEQYDDQKAFAERIKEMRDAKRRGDFLQNEEMDEFSDSLTNIPEGFKIAAARFDAMTDPGGPLDITGTAGAAALAGQESFLDNAQPTIQNITNIQQAVINGESGEELFNEFQRVAADKNMATRGGTSLIAPLAPIGLGVG
jgi:TP901 family phage tail tape measure protein